MNAWSCTSTPLYDLAVWLLIKYKDKQAKSRLKLGTASSFAVHHTIKQKLRELAMVTHGLITIA
jgi:hypothetical protein